MDIVVNHLPFSAAYNRMPNITMRPNSITIHSTGNPTSSAKNERAWLENPTNKRTASWHYVVDENTIIEAIPPNYVAWHAGDGNGQGNMASISIEMCESGNRDRVLVKTKELVKYLMNKHNIRKVVRHYDWTKKNCPRILNHDGKWTDWYPFLADIFKAEAVIKDQTKYRLRSGAFSSAADFAKAVGIVKDKGWLVYEKADSLDLNPSYRFLTGTFEGREAADQKAEELKKHGWLIYIDKA
jgi:N-acetylmuramoyl-L-alanine amidase